MAEVGRVARSNSESPAFGRREGEGESSAADGTFGSPRVYRSTHDACGVSHKAGSLEWDQIGGGWEIGEAG